MNDFDNINEIYLKILQEDQINESIGSKLASAALIGSALIGNLDAANLKNDSSKINDKTSITKTAQKASKISLNEDELFIAKTLYSETSTLCTYEEIIAIGCIIQNRIGLKDFGGCNSAIEVCKHPGVFSSVSTHNSNWDQYKVDLNKFANYDAKVAKILADPKYKLAGYSWTNDIVYYHDKSISKPKSWDNKYYKAVFVKETPKFKFYKIEKVKPVAKAIKKKAKVNKKVKK